MTDSTDKSGCSGKKKVIKTCVLAIREKNLHVAGGKNKLSNNDIENDKNIVSKPKRSTRNGNILLRAKVEK